MTNSPARVWDFILPTLSNQLDYAALIAAGVNVPEFEANPYDDWCFDKGSSVGLTGKIASKILVPNAAAPTYNAKSLVIPATGLNGLKTALADGLNQTIFGVFRRPADPTAVATVFATATTSVSAGGAYVAFQSSGRFIMNTRGYAAAGTLPVAAGAVGTWQFVALSIKDNGDGTSTSILFAGGPTPQSLSQTGTKTLSTAALPWAFGNAYNVAANYDERAIEVQGAGILPVASTVDEMTALYKRKQIVAARRSITVV